MTAREIHDLALRGGGNDFQATVELLERLDVPWCLIGGLAVNAYAEPVYTADADFVIVSTQLEFVCAELAGRGFTISHHFGVNARLPGSGLVGTIYDRSPLPRFSGPCDARRSARRPMPRCRACRFVSRQTLGCSRSRTPPNQTRERKHNMNEDEQNPEMNEQIRHFSIIADHSALPKRLLIRTMLIWFIKKAGEMGQNWGMA